MNKDLKNMKPREMGLINIEHINDYYKRLTYFMTDEELNSRETIKINFPFPGFKHIYFVKAIGKNDYNEDVEVNLYWQEQPLIHEITFYSPNFAHKANININHTIDYEPIKERFDRIIVEYDLY